MPCLFGVVGPAAGAGQRLEHALARTFGPLDVVSLPCGRIGGHAHTPGRAVRQVPDGRVVGVFGERDLYAVDAPLVAADGGALQITPEARGNACAFDPKTNTVTLAADWLTFFPLYYAQTGETFLFSSHLKPLAHAVEASIDPAGLMQILTLNWGLQGRTVFTGIRRLLAGQSLRYDVSQRRWSIVETSKLWRPDAWTDGPVDTRRLWSLITAAVSPSVTTHEPLGLMMSGGWDSRILLAAAVATRGARNVTSFVHGEPRNAELKIARGVAARAGVEHVEIPLGNDAFGSGDDLDQLFDRSEALLFPYWRFAAQRASAMGIPTLACGLLGEIFGGHYTVRGGDAIRIRHYVKQTLFGSEGRDGRGTVDESFRQMFGPLRRVRRPWYLKADFVGDQADRIRETIDADIEAMRQRYVGRGIDNPKAILQAYVVEHRALMMLGNLPMTALAFSDVAMPFSNRRLVAATLSMSFEDRFERRLCQQLLRENHPALLDLPLAATMGLPAKAPMLLHQGARLVRRGLDLSTDRVSQWTGGRVSRTRRFGWMNFDEVMRDGEALEAVTSGLAAEVFDRATIARKIDEVRQHRANVKLGHVYLKMAYLQRMLARTQG